MDVANLAKNATSGAGNLVNLIATLRRDQKTFRENLDLIDHVGRQACVLEESIERFQSYYRDRRRHVSKSVRFFLRLSVDSVDKDIESAASSISEMKLGHTKESRIGKAIRILGAPEERQTLENV